MEGSEFEVPGPSLCSSLPPASRIQQCWPRGLELDVLIG